jgi:putative phage-type endonuclease
MGDLVATVVSDLEAWLADRRRGIGGSDVAAILGLSRFRTAVDVWLDKRGLAEPQPETDAMRFGRLFEPIVLDEFERRTGYEVRRGLPIQTSEEHPFMLASLDGLIEDEHAIVEAKTARTADGWGEDGSSEIPAYYHTQVAHYMAVTDAVIAYVPVLIGGQDFRIYTVERDEAFQADLIEAEREFWESNVLPGIPPAATTAADALLLWARDNGTAIEADDELAETIAKLKAVKAEIKVLEERAAFLDDRVRVAFAEHATLTHRGQVLATFKAQTARRLDVKSLEAAHPDIASTFRRESISRVLRLK